MEQSLLKEKERFHAMMAHLNKVSNLLMNHLLIWKSKLYFPFLQGPQINFDEIGDSNPFRPPSEVSSNLIEIEFVEVHTMLNVLIFQDAIPRYPLELRKPSPVDLPKPPGHDASNKVLETENGASPICHFWIGMQDFEVAFLFQI